MDESRYSRGTGSSILVLNRNMYVAVPLHEICIELEWKPLSYHHQGKLPGEPQAKSAMITNVGVKFCKEFWLQPFNPQTALL